MIRPVSSQTYNWQKLILKCSLKVKSHALSTNGSSHLTFGTQYDSPFKFRDRNGLECDAVVHLHNGKYGLIEIKLGGDTFIEDGAENLKNLASKIDTTKMNPPSFLMVLTGVGDYAFRRKDGVYLVPIGCLKD